MKRLVWQDRPRGISVWVLDDDGPNVVARLRYHWCCLRMQGIADTGVIYHHNERKVTQLFDYEPSTIHLVAEGRDGEALGAVRIVADTERGLPMENRGDWAEVGWPGYDLTGFRKKKNIAHGTAREIGMLVTAPSTGGAKLALFKAVYLLLREEGVVHYFATATPRYARIYAKLGLTPVDEPYQMPTVVGFKNDVEGGMRSRPPVVCTFVPLYMNVAAVERRIVRALRSGMEIPSPLGKKAVSYIAPELLRNSR